MTEQRARVLELVMGALGDRDPHPGFRFRLGLPFGGDGGWNPVVSRELTELHGLLRNRPRGLLRDHERRFDRRVRRHISGRRDRRHITGRTLGHRRRSTRTLEQGLQAHEAPRQHLLDLLAGVVGRRVDQLLNILAIQMSRKETDGAEMKPPVLEGVEEQWIVAGGPSGVNALVRHVL
ncbi:MAG TPA: hypothetical protein VGR66_08730 [Candidatus Eisenbacteria bacterium]|nr:hypothetical protein [Candidatus Eisenbacteria bacterium]